MRIAHCAFDQLFDLNEIDERHTHDLGTRYTFQVIAVSILVYFSFDALNYVSDCNIYGLRYNISRYENE